MGSCFKFKMCRKRAYDFNSQPYEPTPGPTGTYRASTLEVEGWDPTEFNTVDHENKPTEGKLEHVNGDAREETVLETAVVSSPSNSDVTFGGNLVNEQQEEEKVQNEKGSKSSKKKKEKEKEKKNKKEKSKKKSKNKKKKGKDEDSDEAENEMTEKENKDDGQEEEKKEETGDISNMETLPREERHVVEAIETSTVTAGGETVMTETTVTESVVVVGTIDEENDQSDRIVEHIVSSDIVDGHIQDEESEEKVDADDIVIEEIRPEVHVVETTIITETNSSPQKKKSSAKDSHSQSDNEESAAEVPGGSDLDTERGGGGGGAGTIALYPEPDEQIDVIKTVSDAGIDDVTEAGGTVIERTTKTVQETANYGATVTVTKVVTETVEKHGDTAEMVVQEVGEEVAKF